jgi:hypothetical protein
MIVGKEWKSSDFNIIVYRNQRQVEAIYIKDDSSISVTLTLPELYPFR